MTAYPNTFSADEWNFKIINAAKYDDNVIVTTEATKKSVTGQVVFDVTYNSATKALDFDPHEKKCTGDLYNEHINTPDINCTVSFLKQTVRKNVILDASGDLRSEWRSPDRVRTPEIQPRETPDDEGLNSPGGYPKKFTSSRGFEFNIHSAIKRDKEVVVDGRITKKDRSGRAFFDYTFSCDSQQQNIGVNRDFSDGDILVLLESDNDLQEHLENELYQQVITNSKWKPATPEKSEDLCTDEGAEKATLKRPFPCESGDAPASKKANTSQPVATAVKKKAQEQLTRAAHNEIQPADDDKVEEAAKRPTRSGCAGSASTLVMAKSSKKSKEAGPKTPKQIKQSLSIRIKNLKKQAQAFEPPEVLEQAAEDEFDDCLKKLRDYAKEDTSLDDIETLKQKISDSKGDKDERYLRDLAKLFKALADTVDLWKNSDAYNKIMKELNECVDQYTDAWKADLKDPHGGFPSME